MVMERQCYGMRVLSAAKWVKLTERHVNIAQQDGTRSHHRIAVAMAE